MKTFKTRSGAMKRDNAAGNDPGSCIVSISTPPPYLLLLNIKKIDNCIQDANGICSGTASVAYLDFDNPFDVDIVFSKSSFTSNDLDNIGNNIGNYNNIKSINVLNKVEYSVTYKETVTKTITNNSGLPSENDILVKYTIKENKNNVLNDFEKIRKTNKQIFFDAFDRLARYKIYTYEGKVEILRDSAPEAPVAPGPDFSNQDLKGRDFTGAILTGANFTGANLTGANLTGAILTGANLSGAILTGANLTGAILRSANLKGANFTNANLTGAILKGADLTGANLTGADLTGAIR